MTLFLLLLVGISGHGQNLVPNPGFEKNTEGLVDEWKQPHGDFYHYEARWIKRRHVTLERVNGLCLLNKRKSEFLEVELLEPLKEGMTYVVKMDVVVQFKKQYSTDGIDSIDWRFLSEPVDVSTRTIVAEVPDLSFDVTGLSSPDVFSSYRKEYVARGDEKYLLVGKLRNPETLGAFLLQDSLLTLYTNKKKEIENIVHHEIIWLSNGFIEIKNTAKVFRMMKRLQKKLNKKHQLSLDSLERFYQPTIDSLNAVVIDIPDRDIRFYFDNFAIIPLDQYHEEVNGAEQGMPFVAEETYRFNNVVFDTDKDILKTESFIELNNLVAIMNQFPKYHVKLTGHTDSVNTEEYNLTLSRHRVEACVSYLVSQGIHPARLTFEGKGESKPIATNNTEEGRAMNRRVDFMFFCLVRPKTEDGSLKGGEIRSKK